MIELITIFILIVLSLTASAETNLGVDILINGKVSEMQEAGPGETVYQHMCMGPNGPEKCQTTSSVDQQIVIVPVKLILGLVRNLPDSILIDELGRRGFTLKQEKTTSPTMQKGDTPVPEQK